MARPKHEHPRPSLQRRGESWRVRWWHGGKLYSATMGKVDESEARDIMHLCGLALSGRGDWPEELAAEKSVRLYLQAIQDQAAEALVDPDTAEGIKEGYYRHMRANSASAWPNVARGHLTRFFDQIGDPKNINTRSVTAFLDRLTTAQGDDGKPVSNATRNRARAVLSGLFKWMRKNRLRPRTWDPLEDVGPLREERPHEDIVFWEASELPALLDAADKRRDGIAVWIAVLAGLRRGEIQRLHWTDIGPTSITVRKSKTGKKRVVPLSTKLAERLKREKRKGVRVVPWPDAFNGWVAAATDLLEIHLPKKLRQLHAANPKRYPMFAKFDEDHPEKFGWNAFRHTFASRLAQGGLSLDIIAGWMGDSPAVCKEYYARLVPAENRDTRIDLVNF